MTLTERIWVAHPLTLGHRAVLLAVARQIPHGRTEVLVNRGALARELETTPATVGKALMVGEQLGLMQALRSGAVAVIAEGLPGMTGPIVHHQPSVQVPVDEEPSPVVAVQPDGPAAVNVSPGGTVTAQWIRGQFAVLWEAKYKQRYVFQPKDYKMPTVSAIARALSAGEVLARIKNYLKHPDPFYSRATHSFGLWVSRVNEFAVTAGAAAADDEYERLSRKTEERRNDMRRVAR